MSKLSTLFQSFVKPMKDPNTLSAAEYFAQFVSNNVSHRLIDVRSPGEFAESHVVGAVNIPLPELADRLESIARDLPVMLYCRTGNRSGSALQLMQAAGYQDAYNIGGLSDLAQQGLPVESNRVVQVH